MKSKRRCLFFLIFVVAAIFFVATNAFAENISKRLAYSFTEAVSKNNDGCWFCSLFERIFCAGNGMAVSIYAYLGEQCAKLAATMMALWLAWLVGKLVLGFSSGGVDFFQEFAMSLLRLFAVATILLGSSSFIFGYYNVLIKTAADFGALIMQVGVEGGGGTSTSSNPAQKYVDGFRGYPIGYTALKDLNTDEVKKCTSDSRGFSYTAVVSVMQMMQAIHLQLIKFMMLGKYLIDYSFENPLVNIFGFKIPKFEFLMPGLILLISGVWILVATVFKLMDAVIRMLLVCALTPLFAMFWVFPVTRRYTSEAIKTFITVLFMFVITAILLTISLKLLSNIGQVQGNKQASPIELSLGGLYKGDPKNVLDYFKLSGRSFFILICASIVAIKLIGLSSSLAQTLGGGDISGPAGALQAAAGNAAGKATQLAKAATVKGAKASWSATKGAYKEAKFWARQAGKARKG